MAEGRHQVLDSNVRRDDYGEDGKKPKCCDVWDEAMGEQDETQLDEVNEMESLGPQQDWSECALVGRSRRRSREQRPVVEGVLRAQRAVLRRAIMSDHRARTTRLRGLRGRGR